MFFKEFFQKILELTKKILQEFHNSPAILADILGAVQQILYKFH